MCRSGPVGRIPPEKFPLKLNLSLSGARTEFEIQPEFSGFLWQPQLKALYPTAGEIIFENSSSSVLEISDAQIENLKRPFQLIFRDELSIFENSSAWPKYFLARAENSQPDKEAPPVQILEFQPQEIKLQVSSKSSARLMIMESYYPGWRALLMAKSIGLSGQMRRFSRLKFQREPAR
jgi:hypothetical protein